MMFSQPAAGLPVGLASGILPRTRSTMYIEAFSLTESFSECMAMSRIDCAAWGAAFRSFALTTASYLPAGSIGPWFRSSRSASLIWGSIMTPLYPMWLEFGKLVVLLGTALYLTVTHCLSSI